MFSLTGLLHCVQQFNAHKNVDTVLVLLVIEITNVKMKVNPPKYFKLTALGVHVGILTDILDV